MLFNRKGDLAISTNAIVVLIIAVIMLGLIIAFVTKGFSAVSDKFFGQVEQLPPPPTPSGSNPVTTSEVIIGRPGEDFGMKISVYNTLGTATAPAAGVAPSITCLNGGVLDGQVSSIVLATAQVNPKPIPSRSAVTYTYISKVDKAASPGKHLCTVSVVLDSVNPSNSTISSDLTIEVRS